MKKIICLILSVFMLFSLAACGKNLKYDFDENDQGDTIAYVDGMYFTIDEEKEEVTLFNYDGKSKHVRIPDTLNDLPIAGIASTTFADLPVNKISFGENVYFIESYAFQWTAIKNIDIPEGVTYLGKGVFLECEELKEVTLPESLTTIGENIFEGCTNRITVNVTNGSYAQEYCQGLVDSGVDIVLEVK